MEQSKERSSALLYTSVKKLLKREPSGRPPLLSPTYIYIYICVCVCVCVLTRLVVFHIETITLIKVMNLIILPPDMFRS